ncbi:MAG: Spy/CpxP family protein refolding chaperone [Pseudomonadota bacterium]
MKRLSALSVPAWRLVAVGLVVSAAGAFGIVNMASAHGRQDGPPMRHMAGMGLPFMGGPMMERMLDGVHATAAQREQLQQIAQSAQADLQAGAESGRADRERLAELFAQPVVDEAAVESLRRKMLQRHDQHSKRVQQAMLDASKVLTADQRQALVAQLKQHAGRMGERNGRAGQPPSAPPAQ